ncbi:hypothetical protein AAC387_Pa10g0118 [Persea americana]
MQRRFHCDKLRLVVKYPDIFGAYDFPRAAAADEEDVLVSFHFALAKKVSTGILTNRVPAPLMSMEKSAWG